MKISPQFKRSYPKLSNWIECEIPKVKGKPKVFAAFLKYAELNKKKAKLALQKGQPPEINFDTMPNSNGRFSGKKFPNKVFLAKAICDRFESTDSKNLKMHLLLESTLLHEMVHWGDWKDGIDHPKEEGKEFEKEAYGRDINRYW